MEIKDLDLANDGYHFHQLEEMRLLKENLLSIGLCVNNEYLDKYCELIVFNKGNEYIKGKSQKHHIIPKFFYRINKLEINNHSSNLVFLSRKNHSLAHYYLLKCSKTGLIFTYNFLTTRYILSNKIELFQENEKELLKIINELENYHFEMPEESKLKISKARTGIHLSKETKDKLREINLGKHPSIETRRKLSMVLKGYKMSEESKKRLSESKKGNKNPMYGKIGPMKNKKHSEETKKLISEKCTGYKHTEEAKRKITEANLKRWKRIKEQKENERKSEQN